LYREPRPSIADEPWTAEDLFCLDELSHLLNGEVRTYGHVVVDEAQDLSPMQARALARRCPEGAFTVLGDLAQATGPWIRDDWSELTDHLADTPATVETLTIGYRVPALALGLAARLLPHISPDLSAPRSVRAGAGSPTVHLDLDVAAERRALDVARADVDAELTTAVVVPDEAFDEVWSDYRQQVPDLGDGRSGEFGQPLTLVPASLVKGLEFDSVVVLHPTRLSRASVDGLRLLYVAMTRCTQVLRLVDDDQLPVGLDHLLPAHLVRRNDDAVIEEVVPVVSERQRDDLVELIEQLDEDDRRLVTSLVRRLLQGGIRDTLF
jgi:DNA helicase IV